MSVYKIACLIPIKSSLLDELKPRSKFFELHRYGSDTAKLANADGMFAILDFHVTNIEKEAVQEAVKDTLIPCIDICSLQRFQDEHRKERPSVWHTILVDLEKTDKSKCSIFIGGKEKTMYKQDLITYIVSDVWLTQFSRVHLYYMYHVVIVLL